MEVSATQLQQNVPNLTYKTYHKNFFILQTEIVVNGQQAQVDVDENGWLTLNCRNPKVGVTFDTLVTDVNEILRQHGLHGISNYWCEDVPLFELKGTSQNELQKLLSLEGEIQKELALKINMKMKTSLQHSATSGSPPSLHVLVQPQLYLLIPDYTHMDGKLIPITKTNISECMTLFGESMLFDFGAIFRASRNNSGRKNIGPEDFHELIDELYQVMNWYNLGLHLKIPEYQLQAIRQDNPHNTEMCRTKMPHWWWDNAEERRWTTLVQALAKSGSRVLASTIAVKHSVPVPPLRNTDTTGYVQDATNKVQTSGLVEVINALVQKLGSSINNQDREVAEREQSFQQAEQEKKAASQRIQTLEYKLNISECRVKQLIKEKNDVLSSLKLLELEFQLLRQAATDQIQLQQQCISHKENEIAILKAKLQSVEKELDETKRQIVPALKEELQKASLELKNKSTEVQLLREAKTDMRLLLDMEKRVLDNYLMQQTAANVSHERFRHEVKLQHHYLKETSEMSVKEMEAFHEYLENRDPQLKEMIQYVSSAQYSDSPQGTTSTIAEVPVHPNNGQQTQMRESIEMLLCSTCNQVNEHQSQTEEVQTDSEDVGYTIGHLHWKERKRVPQAIVRGAAAIYGHTIYVIGENSNTIHYYCVTTNQWSTLSSPCPHINPGLVFIKNALTAVGGEKKSQSTSKVTSWNNGRWTTDIPSMMYPHSSPSVLNSGSFVLVAGGARNNEKSVVEVFSLEIQVWCKVVSLPMPFYGITTTLCRDDYIIMDGDGCTYSMGLSQLTSTETSSPSWKELGHVPSVVGEPTLSTFRQQAICVCSDGIYQLYNEAWVRIQDNFNFSSWSKSIVRVIDEKLMVIGGFNPYSNSSDTEVNLAYELM